MDGNVKTAEEIMEEIEDLRQIIADFEAGETGGAALRDQLEKEIAARKLAVKELSQERNKFESMLGAMQSGITIRDLDFNITYQNETITEIFGDRIGEKCYRAYEGRDQVCQGCPVILAYEDGKSHTSLRKVTAPSGQIQFWENTANPIRDANGKIVSGLEVYKNITKRKNAEEMLLYRYRFETILSDITATFVDVASEELDGRINNALEKIGQFAGIDRSYVFQFCDDGHLVDNTHEWCADGIKPQIDNLKGIEVVNEMPFFAEKMQKHEVFHVPSVAELGPEASAEKKHFQLQDIKSLLVVPMAYRQHLRGFIGFDSVSEQKMWSDDDIALLKTVGVVLTEALVRKQNEEKLRCSEEQYRVLVEGTGNFVTRVDNEGKFLFVNETSENIYGVKPEECIGRLAFDFIHPDDRQPTREAFEKWLQERPEDISFENRQIGVNGEIHHMLWKIKIVTDDNNQIKWIDSIAQDITDRKQAEEKLIENEKRFRQIMYQSPSVIEFYDLDGLQVEVNHAYEDLWGFPAEHTVGKFNVLKSKEVEDSGLMEYVKRAYAGETVTVPEYEFDSTGDTEGKGLGRKRWLSTRIYPLKDNEGNVKNIVITHEDISDRMKAEKDREDLLKKLSFRNRELQSMVYISSHDLKSPLVNIEGFSGELGKHCEELTMLLENSDLSKEKKKEIATLLKEDIPESLRFIRFGTRKMKDLLDGLLQVSRFGSAEIRIEQLDMNKLMQSILDTMQFQIEEKSISVRVDDLPACLGDFYQISRVFSNILDNAIKYLDPDRKGVMCVSGITDNGQRTYCIEDNGIGIEKNHQDKVFEIFHRLDPSSSIAGEGLGLTIATRILDRHDGTIRVESEPGKGTKFFVTLPRA